MVVRYAVFGLKFFVPASFYEIISSQFFLKNDVLTNMLRFPYSRQPQIFFGGHHRTWGARRNNASIWCSV